MGHTQRDTLLTLSPHTMPAISTQDLFANAARLKGRVVIITGAAAGFGRAVSVEYAKHGAKLVLGDVDEKGVKETARLVEKNGGQAVYTVCDVASWDSQLALFAKGFQKFGCIDIVLPNAGIGEVGRTDHRLEAGDPYNVPQDRPTPPNLKTLEIDLIAVLYTTRIALWYFCDDKRDNPGLRAIAFTGSMSSFYGATYGPMYGAAKAGVLGIQKGLIETAKSIDVRVVTVCPYFVKTGIITKDFVHPNPKQGWAQIEDVVGAFVGSVTDPDEKTNFTAWLIPDDKGVFRMETSGYLVGAEAARRPRPAKGSKL